MRTVKPLSAFCSILAAAFSMCAAECCGMETLSLDGLWDFSFSEGGVLAEATAEFTADGKMPVPGCFDMMPPWRMIVGAKRPYCSRISSTLVLRGVKPSER